MKNRRCCHILSLICRYKGDMTDIYGKPCAASPLGPCAVDEKPWSHRYSEENLAYKEECDFWRVMGMGLVWLLQAVWLSLSMLPVDSESTQT